MVLTKRLRILQTSCNVCVYINKISDVHLVLRTLNERAKIVDRGTIQYEYRSECRKVVSLSPRVDAIGHQCRFRPVWTNPNRQALKHMFRKKLNGGRLQRDQNVLREGVINIEFPDAEAFLNRNGTFPLKLIKQAINIWISQHFLFSFLFILKFLKT